MLDVPDIATTAREGNSDIVYVSLPKDRILFLSFLAPTVCTLDDF
jgi:hypothetical protein